MCMIKFFIKRVFFSTIGERLSTKKTNNQKSRNIKKNLLNVFLLLNYVGGIWGDR